MFPGTGDLLTLLPKLSFNKTIIMDNLPVHSEAFKVRMHASLRLGITESAIVKVAKHKNIYRCGDKANTVYFIESGLIKLLMSSPEGKECLLAIHTAGDVFGELCLCGARERLETAIAMRETIVRAILCHKFIVHLNANSLLADFVGYLVARLAERDKTIANLITADSEHRLGEILIQLAGKIGKPAPPGTRIEQRFTHEELSEMVGTTRPRITEFLQRFRKLGLVEISPEHHLIVKQDKLIKHLIIQ